MYSGECDQYMHLRKLLKGKEPAKMITENSLHRVPTAKMEKFVIQVASIRIVKKCLDYVMQEFSSRQNEALVLPN